MHTSSSINSRPDSGFVPRKEFIRENKSAPNSFALLAIASSNCLRLYSFPDTVIASLRRLFESLNILVLFREDLQHSLCEFSLDGKPWANPKVVATEKLLVDILAIIYQCGYAYLSTLDYGREHDDRLAIAFSKPSISGSREGTPLPASSSPLLDGSGSSKTDISRSKRIPFALSFASSSLMRVIAPPLHLTPAILQAVRGSWPRGVVSEKKVGHDSFEFKLKGYKWFQQDTFATDSLRHILALLSSLDAQSFTLLSSISLMKRSRHKDLWIFTGPASDTLEGTTFQDSPAPSILDAAHGRIMRQATTPEPPTPNQMGAPLGHRRLATEPGMSLSHPVASQRVRATSEDGQRAHHGPGQQYEYHRPGAPVNAPATLPGVLRKPAPRAQVPVSVAPETEAINAGFRANLPSVISSSAENMTGVGATGFAPFGSIDSVGRSTSPFTPAPVQTFSGDKSTNPTGRIRSPLRPVSSRAKTPPLLVSRSPPTPSSPVYTHSPVEKSSSSHPQLLGAGTFRDSAFSSNSELSCEIPIQWTGSTTPDSKLIKQHERFSGTKYSTENRISSTGPITGGWQPTPIEEKSEEGESVTVTRRQQRSVSPDNEEDQTTPVHEVVSRVVSPELNGPDGRLRKSEAALVGMVAETLPPLASPTSSRERRTQREEPGSPGSGHGWVLVNVEGAGYSSPAESGSRKSGEASTSRSPELPSSPNSKTKGYNTPKLASPEHTTMSPAAKAIVIIDAVDANSKSKYKPDQDRDATPPLRKRLFSLGRKNSKKATQVNYDPTSNEGQSVAKPRSGFRDRLRLIGTPEAPRNEDKRRSID